MTVGQLLHVKINNKYICTLSCIFGCVRSLTLFVDPAYDNVIDTNHLKVLYKSLPRIGILIHIAYNNIIIIILLKLIIIIIIIIIITIIIT